MSAIFGIIDLQGRLTEEEWVVSVQTDLAHRGPDGSGLYRDDQVVLGHMLLRVTPESAYDRSPYEEDGLVITADARLDERDDLMERLEVTHEERSKITDPLLLLRAYRKYGKDFVRDIYGDFAFAIWDKRKKELFCARDHMGIKPLLYYFHDGRFVFSTELKAIVNLQFIETGPDHMYLRDHALGISSLSCGTGWQNIIRLMPANTLTLKGSGPEVCLYWHRVYKRNKKFRTAEDSAIALREVLERVIADHTRVSGDVGVPLSGGLDSGTLACMSSRHLKGSGRKVVTASSVFDRQSYDNENKDESEYINEILKQEEGIDPLFVKHTELSFSRGIKEKLDFHFSPVNGFWYVDEALFAKLQGRSVRRVLSGYMGDMTVSNSQFNPFMALFLRGSFGELKELIRQTAAHTGQTPGAVLRSKVIYELLPGILRRITGGKSGSKNAGMWSINDFPLIYSKGEKRRLQKTVNDYFLSSGIKAGDAAGNIWLVKNDNLGDEWDCGSSHHMLEMTYPFADRRVVELLLTIPAGHFYAGGQRRGLIRMAMKGILPEKVRQRNDKGLYSPGYPQIINRDIKEIIRLIEKNHFEQMLRGQIEWGKLKKDVEKHLNVNNMNSFVFANWVIIDLIIWVFFEGYRTMRRYTI